MVYEGMDLKRNEMIKQIKKLIILFQIQKSLARRQLGALHSQPPL